MSDTSQSPSHQPMCQLTADQLGAVLLNFGYERQLRPKDSMWDYRHHDEEEEVALSLSAARGAVLHHQFVAAAREGLIAAGHATREEFDQRVLRQTGHEANQLPEPGSFKVDTSHTRCEFRDPTTVLHHLLLVIDTRLLCGRPVGPGTSYIVLEDTDRIFDTAERDTVCPDCLAVMDSSAADKLRTTASETVVNYRTLRQLTAGQLGTILVGQAGYMEYQPPGTSVRDYYYAGAAERDFSLPASPETVLDPAVVASVRASLIEKKRVTAEWFDNQWEAAGVRDRREQITLEIEETDLPLFADQQIQRFVAGSPFQNTYEVDEKREGDSVEIRTTERKRLGKGPGMKLWRRLFAITAGREFFQEVAVHHRPWPEAVGFDGTLGGEPVLVLVRVKLTEEAEEKLTPDEITAGRALMHPLPPATTKHTLEPEPRKQLLELVEEELTQEELALLRQFPLDCLAEPLRLRGVEEEPAATAYQKLLGAGLIKESRRAHPPAGNTDTRAILTPVGRLLVRRLHRNAGGPALSGYTVQDVSITRELDEAWADLKARAEQPREESMTAGWKPIRQYLSLPGETRFYREAASFALGHSAFPGFARIPLLELLEAGAATWVEAIMPSGDGRRCFPVGDEDKALLLDELGFRVADLGDEDPWEDFKRRASEHAETTLVSLEQRSDRTSPGHLTRQTVWTLILEFEFGRNAEGALAISWNTPENHRLLRVGPDETGVVRALQVVTPVLAGKDREDWNAARKELTRACVVIETHPFPWRVPILQFQPLECNLVRPGYEPGWEADMTRPGCPPLLPASSSIPVTLDHPFLSPHRVKTMHPGRLVLMCEVRTPFY